MNKYKYGRLENTRLCDILAHVLGLFPDHQHFIVRSIDSSTNSESISKVLNRYQICHNVYFGNVALTRESVLEANGKRVFTGFDEIWILGGICECDLNSVPRATSDAEDFSASVPNEILSVAQACQCLLIIADGSGLNYCAKIELANILEQLFLNQKRLCAR